MHLIQRSSPLVVLQIEGVQGHPEFKDGQMKTVGRMVGSFDAHPCHVARSSCDSLSDLGTNFRHVQILNNSMHSPLNNSQLCSNCKMGYPPVPVQKLTNKPRILSIRFAVLTSLSPMHLSIPTSSLPSGNFLCHLRTVVKLKSLHVLFYYVFAMSCLHDLTVRCTLVTVTNHV